LEQQQLLSRINDPQNASTLLLATAAVALAVTSGGTGGSPDGTTPSSASARAERDAEIRCLVESARAGTLGGLFFPPPVVAELQSWHESEVRFVGLLLSGIDVGATLLAASSPPPPASDAADDRLHSLISRDCASVGACPHAYGVRTYVPLGYPLGTADTYASRLSDALFVDSERQRAYEQLWPALDELLRDEAARGGLLHIAWDVQSGEFGAFQTWLGKRALRADLSLALLSLGVIYVFIVLHSRSLLLGTLGALEIFCSFPLALGVYRLVLGVRLFGVMHTIGIYVILGIGCDDLFVLLDAWNQVWMAPPECQHSMEARMWWAYQRAIKAMLVTTITDVSAFLSTLICIVPNLVSFAIFTALLAVANFALVCTMWPCAIVLYERHRVWWQRHALSCCCGPPARAQRTSLAAADSAAEASHEPVVEPASAADAPQGTTSVDVEGGGERATDPTPTADDEQLETISLDPPSPAARPTTFLSSMRRSNKTSPTSLPASLPASPPASPPAVLPDSSPASAPVTRPAARAPPPLASHVGASPDSVAECATGSSLPCSESTRHVATPGSCGCEQPVGTSTHAVWTNAGSGDGGGANGEMSVGELSASYGESSQQAPRGGLGMVSMPLHMRQRDGHGEPHSSRFIERFYAERYTPFLTRGRNALWVLAASSVVRHDKRSN
jgi:hypothetical protein